MLQQFSKLRELVASTYGPLGAGCAITFYLSVHMAQTTMLLTAVPGSHKFVIDDGNQASICNSFDVFLDVLKADNAVTHLAFGTRAGRQGIVFSVSDIFEGFRIIECESRGLKPKA
jgi:hypothetical protein